MRIRRPTPGVLIVQERAIRSRVVGGSCVLLACTAFLIAGSLSAPGRWAAVFIGALAGVFGLLALRGIAAQTVTFDRAAGVVRIRTQHVLGSSATLHRLIDVADVVVEQETMANGRLYYRTAFVMRDGTHRGWTAYAFPEHCAGLIAAVREIREFLGTAASLAAPDGTVAIPQPIQNPTGLTLKQRRLIVLGSVFVYVVSSTLTIGGVWFAWNEHVRRTTYVPVTATVGSVGVISARDQRNQVIERPAVEYRYQVSGKPYSSDRVTMLGEYQTGHWAETVADRYHAGQSLTAYYNPRQPTEAYLDPTTSLSPWMLIGFPLLFMGVWTVALRSTLRGNAQPLQSPASITPVPLQRAS